MEDHTTERTCRKCGTTYPLTIEYFVRNKRMSLGFEAQCKTCQYAAKKAWYESNPDKVKDMKKKDRENNRERIKSQQQRWAENNPDHLKEYRQNYYAENREDKIGKSLQYQRDNPEKVNAKNKRWAENNPERAKLIRQDTYRRNQKKISKRIKDYYQKHPDKKRALGRQWYWNNREKAIAKVQRRRAAEGSYTQAEITELYEEQGCVCFYCSEPLGNDFHRDHYVPLSRGGTNWIENIVLACEPCNLSKSDKLPTEWKGRFQAA